MIPKKDDIEDKLSSFVKDAQFENFKAIMNSFAESQFKSMQGKDIQTYDQMLSAKEVLKFYMSLPTYLENKLRSIEKKKAAELTEKINRAQEEL